MLIDKKPHILLVEDNPDDVELVKHALQNLFITCDLHHSGNGEEAIDYLSKCQPVPDLVILDLSLPKMSGHEVLTEMRRNEKTTNIPVLIFTSSVDPNDRARCIDSGANSFIKKSFDSQEVKTALKNLDVYWLLK